MQTLEWVARPHAFLERCARRYGEPFTLRTAWAEGPVVLVWSPDEVRRVFTGGLRAAGSRLLEPFAGPSSILVLEDEAHLAQRRAMAPPFHGDRMRALAPLVARLAEAEVARWRPGELATLPRMQSLTLDVIVRTVFGTGHDALREDIRRALDVVASLPRLTTMALLPRRRVWAPFRSAVGRVDARLAELIAAGGRPGTILAELEGTPGELRDQVVTLLAAGHETTATALAWGMERLARHPQALARVRDGDEAYLDAVVKEILRTRPVLSIAPRTTREPFVAAGHTVPPGTQVAACLHLALRRRETWGDPEAFRPERWLDGGTPEGYAFIPWGGGVRRCLGAAFATMEMREVVRAVARRTRLAARGGDEPARRRSVAIAPGRGARVVVLGE